MNDGRDGERAWLVLLVLAFAIRLAIALAFPNIIAPDEIYQTIEQAHRLVFGAGIVPWEFQVGMRSWLIPLVLAGPMALAHLCFADPLVGLVLIRVLLVVASLPIVWCAARWGERFYGRQGGWIAGLFAASWPDLWVMAPHALAEVVAADLFGPAVYLATGVEKTPRAVAVAGLLLGACFVVRLQMAPAVAIIGIMLCGRDRRNWGVALAAGAVPVVAAGALDWVTWGQPFRSFWLYVDLNELRGVANEFGTQPAGYYVSLMTLDWLWSFPLVLGLLWLGARRMKAALLAVLAIVLMHSLVAHKELRFIFPAIALAAPLAGVGLAGMFAAAPGRTWLKAGVAGLALAGPLASPLLYFELAYETNSLGLFETLRAKSPCLIAVGPFSKSFLPLDIIADPSMRLTGMEVFGQPEPRPDYIVATARSITVPAGYRLDFCHSGNWSPYRGGSSPDFCVWVAATPHVTAGSAPAFGLHFPQAARRYVVPDRF